MRHDHRQLREIFHFLFLEKLLKTVDPRLFVLKGGVNLRFYFQSPRYSEDLDLDVLGGSVATLRKNGYRILADRSLQRSLESFGIARMDINDPTRAKHSETTQRFRLRLVTGSGIELPTKVEFSRRPSQEAFENALIDPAVAGRYGRLSFASQHYTAAAAFHQKVLALANRAQVQAFLEPEFAREFEEPAAWDQVLERVSGLLDAEPRG
jgi:predicted nucleotidyltransferase component of viral defense system